MFKNGNLNNKNHSDQAFPKSISFNQLIGSKGRHFKNSVFNANIRHNHNLSNINSTGNLIRHYKEENLLIEDCSILKGLINKLNTSFYEDDQFYTPQPSSINKVVSPKIKKKDYRGSVPLSLSNKKALLNEIKSNSNDYNRDTVRSFMHSARSCEQFIKLNESSPYNRSTKLNTSNIINNFIQSYNDPNRSLISQLENDDKLAGNIQDIIRLKKSNLSVSDLENKNGNLNATSNVSKFIEDESIFVQSFTDRKIIKKRKVYDSMSLDEEELLKLTGIRNFIIEPDSKQKYYWDLYISILIYSSIMSVSFLLAFPNFSNSFTFIINCLTDITFLFDLILNFFVGFYDAEENIIRSHQSIAGNYLTTWFIYDFLSCIPSNTILDILDYDVQIQYVKTNKLSGARVLRLFKFIKCMFQKTKNSEVNKIMEKLSIEISSYSERLLSFFFYFIIISHNIACLWIYVGLISQPNWITQYDFIGISPTELYIASLYFNLTTIYTIGYGDICSVSIYERIYNITLMIVGIFLYSYAVTSLSNMFASDDERKKKYKQGKFYLDELNSMYDIPENLLTKINKFLKFNLRSSNKDEKNSLILELPYSLKQNMICQMYKDIIENFKFFKYIGNNRDFNCRVALTLRPVKAYKDDIILARNEFVNELIFIKCGTLSLELEYLGEKVKIVEIHKHEHFGDVLMFLNEKSPVNVKVSSKVAELYLMKKIDLIKIFSDFSDIYNDIYDASLFNYLKIKNIVKYQRRRIRLLFNFKRMNIKKKKTLLKSKSTKTTALTRMLEEEEKSNLDKKQFLSSNNNLDQTIIIKRLDTVKSIDESCFTSHKKINENDEQIKDTNMKIITRSNSLRLRKISRSTNKNEKTKNIFENLKISSFKFDIISKLNRDILSVNDRFINRGSLNNSGGEINTRNKTFSKKQSKKFSIKSHLSQNKNINIKNKDEEKTIIKEEIIIDRSYKDINREKFKELNNRINSHSKDKSDSPDRKVLDKNITNTDISSIKDENKNNTIVSSNKAFLDSNIIANNIKKNIADISNNFKDPKNFYSNLFSNIKKEKELELINTKINKKLDDLIIILNSKNNIN